METTRFNVGGILYKCYTKTLQRFPGTLISSLNPTSEHYDDIAKEYFFDRNPLVFHFVLDAYRTGALHMPGNVCGSKFREELQFWGLSESLVSKCCWEALYATDISLHTIHTLQTFYEPVDDTAPHHGHVRKLIWQFLHEPRSSKYAKVWAVFLSVLISISVLEFALESVYSLRTDTLSDADKATMLRAATIVTGNNTDATLFRLLLREPHVLIYILDTFCFVVLSVELVIVFWVCPRRWELIKCWIHMSEVVCSLAFWVFFVCEHNLDNIESVHLIRLMIVCKHLTMLRLVRLFRIAGHISELKIMGLSISVSKYELGVLSLMLFMLTSLFGVCMYLVEATENATFSNMFTGMYWALITLTTVGYGSYTPATPLGHLLAGLCSICGVIILALPIGIFASNFYRFYSHHRYVCLHMKYRETNTEEHTSSNATLDVQDKASF